MTSTKTLIQAARMARACVEPEPFHRQFHTAPEDSRITGRNGTFDITNIEIQEVGDKVYIRGIGKKGKVVHGGMRVTKHCFETMCREYVLHGIPTKEDEDE